MNRRIKVIFLITDLPRDGAQRQLLELVKGLDKRRFQPIVLTLNPGGYLEQEFKRVRGVHLLSVGRKGKYDFLCFFRVLRIMRRMKADVVQPFLTPATLFGLVPALFCRTPVKIVTERNGPQIRAGTGQRLYLKAEDMLSRFADWAISNSRAGRDFLIQRGIKPSRVKVIYNGINLDRLHPDRESVERVRQKIGIPQGGKVVGMMARMFPPKNHALFLQAAALVNQSAPQTRFALLGDGPLRGSLEEMSRKLRLESEIVFLGEQQDVGTYLSSFDIAVMSSDTEGCSNSLLEAMALGIPVIATDVGGNREVVSPGENGLLVPPGNAEALAKAIITVLENPGLVKSMGEKARQRVVTEFSLERMVSQYESLYQETLTEKANRRKSSSGSRRRARELLLFSTTTKLNPTAKERISRLLSSALDWRHLVDLANFHGVAPLLANNLSNGDFSSRIPSLYLKLLKDAYNQTLFRNLVYSTELEELLSIFNQHNLKAIELKGFDLAENLYGNPGLRPMCDIDILVKPEDLESAGACLVKAGYIGQTQDDIHPFHTTYYKKTGSLFTAVELHWALEDKRLVDFPYREIWERSKTRLVQGTPVLTLSLEDSLMFLSHHLIKNDDQWLKSLCDIAELLKKHEGSLDWDYVCHSAMYSWHIGSAVYYSLRRARELFGAPVPDLVLKKVRPGVLRWWLLDLLMSREALVLPYRSETLRNNTQALAQSMMMSRPRQMLLTFTRRRSTSRRGAWFWDTTSAVLAITAAMGGYLGHLISGQTLRTGAS